MNHIDFFKLQAKNLFRDYKTQIRTESGGCEYKPRFFDVDRIIADFDINENGEFTLMNAQHIIAIFAGFRKWTDLNKASVARLELEKQLFLNRRHPAWDNIFEDWKMYEQDNLEGFDDDSKLAVFKEVFLGASLKQPKARRKRTKAHLKAMKQEGNQYTYYLEDFEYCYLAGFEGLKSIKAELNSWSHESQKIIVDELLNYLFIKRGIVANELKSLLDANKRKKGHEHFYG